MSVLYKTLWRGDLSPQGCVAAPNKPLRCVRLDAIGFIGGRYAAQRG